jgi:hypothetical protein
VKAFTETAICSTQVVNLLKPSPRLRQPAPPPDKPVSFRKALQLMILRLLHSTSTVSGFEILQPSKSTPNVQLCADSRHDSAELAWPGSPSDRTHRSTLALESGGLPAMVPLLVCVSRQAGRGRRGPGIRFSTPSFTCRARKDGGILPRLKLQYGHAAHARQPGQDAPPSGAWVSTLLYLLDTLCCGNRR